MRFLRTLLVFKLGAYAGLAGAAALMKRVLPSRGDEASDELALVAIFEGIRLADVGTADGSGPDAPTLRVEGLAALGGISIAARAPAASEI